MPGQSRALFIAVLVFAACFLLHTAYPEEPGSAYYSGTVGGSRIGLEMAVQNGKIYRVRYFYVKYKKEIELRVISSTPHIILSESGGGKFELRLKTDNHDPESAAALEGTWTSDDGKRVLPVSLTKITPETFNELSSGQGNISGAPPLIWNWHNQVELGQSDEISRLQILSDRRQALITALHNLEAQDPAGCSAKEIHLHDTGAPDMLVRSNSQEECGATGNCSLWVFTFKNGRYRPILNGVARSITVQPSTANGYHDVVLAMHSSAFASELGLFRFDGTKYRKSGCYEALWSVLGKDGEYHELKEPTVSPCGK